MRTVEGSEWVNLTQPGIIASLSSLAWAWLLLIATLLHLGDLGGSIEFCRRHNDCARPLSIPHGNFPAARSRYILLVSIGYTHIFHPNCCKAIYALAKLTNLHGNIMPISQNWLKKNLTPLVSTRILPLDYSMH